MKTMRMITLCLALMAAVGMAAAERQIKAGATVAVKGVEKVRNYSAVKLFYTQGSNSTVRVVEKGAGASVVTVDNGTLTITCPGAENTINSDGTTTVYNVGRYNQVETEVYLTLPRLAEVDNTCSLKMKAGAMGVKGASLRLTNSGSMDVDVDALDCGGIELLNLGSMGLTADRMGAADKLKISNSGSMRLNVSGRLYGSTVYLSNSGSLTMKTSLVKADKMSFINLGAVPALEMAVECSSYKHSNSGSERSGSTIKVTAPTAYISNSGVLSDNFDMSAKRADEVSVVNLGIMNSRVKFNGGKAKFTTNGTGTITASVKCSDLTLSNTGTGTIKAEGSTGNLWMNGNNGNGFDVRQLTTNGKAKATFFDDAGGNTYNNGNMNRLKKRINDGSVNQYNP